MIKNKAKSKIAVVVSTPFIVRSFLVKHLEILSLSYDICLILNKQSLQDDLDYLPNNVNIIDIPIARKIKVFNDFYVLILLFNLFKKNKYQLVFSVTPKAGLLAMLSSYLANIPNRIHFFTGQVWSNKKGFLRVFLKNMDRAISIFSTDILIDSLSQKELLLSNRIVNNKSIVIGDGSICGVDLDRFSPNLDNKINIRKELGISKDFIVFLYMGRLNKEKGVVELFKAFKELLKLNPQTYLLIIGPDEDNIQKFFNPTFNNNKRNYKYLPYTFNPEKYFQIVDVLCIPSYREGFGNVVIEAAACGIPAIGSNICGLTDSIQHNETGLLVEKGNIDDLFIAMKSMAQNHKKRKLMGENARCRAIDKFSQDIVVKGFIDIINNLLEN